MRKRRKEVALVVAMTESGIIGINNTIPWKSRKDLRRFQRLTSGHTLIMGRKTFESLPHKPLPRRRNIVLSRNPDFKYEGVDIAKSLHEALDMVQERNLELAIKNRWKEIDTLPFVIGGSSVYQEALPLASYFYLSEMLEDVKPKEGDDVTYFPKWDRHKWEEIACEEEDDHTFFSLIRSTQEDPRYKFVIMESKSLRSPVYIKDTWKNRNVLKMYEAAVDLHYFDSQEPAKWEVSPVAQEILDNMNDRHRGTL